MTQQTPAERQPVLRFVRRTAAALLLGFVLFAILWTTVFNAATSALVASGGAVVLVAGASVSETFQAIFETVTGIVLGILGAIAEVFSSIFD